ncbi:MAG: alkaline phosphatase D family protein, partial [Bdellovibrionia bacterium]
MDTSKWLGPFLCKPSEKSMGFWISRGPTFSESTAVEILVRSKGQLIQKVSLGPFKVKTSYGILLGVANNLEPNTRYEYEIKVDSESWIPNGLTSEDLFFQTMPASTMPKNELDFVLMSCHGVEAYENKYPADKSKAWNMWQRLDSLLSKETLCRLAVLGGDQVYMDDTFGENLSKFDEKDITGTKQKIYDAYFYYWSQINYRKVLARIPAILMWDDHDIIDGWGSREEAHRSTLKDKWKTYGILLKEAFQEMQACRNSTTQSSSDYFSFSTNWNKSGFLALDLRSQRSFDSSTGRATMMSAEHKRKIEKDFEELAKTELNTLYVVSPVTIARMGSSIERTLGGLANMLWSLAARISYGESWKRASFWFGIFIVFYCSLYSNIPNSPALVQSTILSLFSILILAKRTAIERYLPSLAKTISHSLMGILALALLTLGFALYRADSMEGGLVQVLQKGIRNSFITSIDESLKGIALAAVGLLFWAKQWNKKLQALGIGATVVLFIFSWWKGLPGWKLSLETTLPILVYAIFGIITGLIFLIGLMERHHIIDEVAGLDDDLRDAWSSESNAEDLVWLASVLDKFARTSKAKIFMLCGDIHTGGLSELYFSVDGRNTILIPQITSSPISYVVMPTMVEKLTSSGDRIKIVDTPNVSVVGT